MQSFLFCHKLYYTAKNFIPLLKTLYLNCHLTSLKKVAGGGEMNKYELAYYLN